VAQRQEVDPGLYAELGVGHEERCRLHEPVDAHAVGEADVVADRDVVEPGVRHPRGDGREPGRPVGFDVLLAQDDPDARLSHGRLP
jgi:hypothetical protein